MESLLATPLIIGLLSIIILKKDIQNNAWTEELDLPTHFNIYFGL